jgi:hypothetical protein
MSMNGSRQIVSEVHNFDKVQYYLINEGQASASRVRTGNALDSPQTLLLRMKMHHGHTIGRPVMRAWHTW